MYPEELTTLNEDDNDMSSFDEEETEQASLADQYGFEQLEDSDDEAETELIEPIASTSMKRKSREMIATPKRSKQFAAVEYARPNTVMRAAASPTMRAAASPTIRATASPTAAAVPTATSAAGVKKHIKVVPIKKKPSAFLYKK